MTVRPRERIKHQKLMAISLNNKKQRCQFFAPFFQRNLFECFPSLIASCLSYSFLLQNFRQSKNWLTAGVMQKKKKKDCVFITQCPLMLYLSVEDMFLKKLSPEVAFMISI